MRVIKPDTLTFLFKRIGAEQGMVLSATILAAFSLDADAPDRVLPERTLWPMVRKAMDRGEVFEWSLPKSEAEFLVYGACRVPAPVRAAQVRVSVGEKTKTLDVYGDRFWRGGRPGDPEPFTAMPVSWQRSYGGPDFPENPLGLGRTPDETGRVALPNILPEGAAPGSPDEIMLPAGLRAIRPDRPSRRRHFGKFDDKWLAERWPFYPSGTSFAFCLTAPEDQRMGRFFNGEETLSLTNMVPEKPSFTSRLPGLRPRLFLLRRDGGLETARERPIRSDTLWLFPDAQAGILAWRNLTLVPDDDLDSVPRCLLALERMVDPPRPEEEYLAMLRERPAKAAGPAIARPSPPAGLTGPAKPAAPKPAAQRPTPLDPEAEAALAELRAATAEIRKRADAALAGRGIAPQALETETAAHPMASSLHDLIKIYAPPDEIDKKLLQRALDESAAKLTEHADAILAKTGVRPEDVEKLTAAGTDAEPDLNRLAQTMEKGRGAPGDVQPHGDDIRTALAGLAGAASALEKEAQAAAKKKTPGPKAAGPSAQAAQATQAAKTRPDLADVLARRASGRSLAGLDLRGLDLSGQALAGADFTGCRLEGAILAKADLTGAIFDRAALTGADFSNARADRARFTDCLAEKSVFAGASLGQAVMTGGEFGGADFSGAALGCAVLDKASFAGARLCGALGRGLQAQKTDFSKANLARTNLADARLDGADLSRAVLSGADLRRISGSRLRLEGATGEKVLLCGASLVNARADAATTLPGADFRRCDLSRAGFAEAKLPGANFKRADLCGAMFAKADLTGANLRKVKARRARFEKAVLARASLYKADLFKASLRKTDLTAAALVKASLHGADLFKCVLREAAFPGANLNRTVLDPRIFRHGK